MIKNQVLNYLDKLDDEKPWELIHQKLGNFPVGDFLDDDPMMIISGRKKHTNTLPLFFCMGGYLLYIIKIHEIYMEILKTGFGVKATRGSKPKYLQRMVYFKRWVAPPVVLVLEVLLIIIVTVRI